MLQRRVIAARAHAPRPMERRDWVPTLERGNERTWERESARQPALTSANLRQVQHLVPGPSFRPEMMGIGCQ